MPKQSKSSPVETPYQWQKSRLNSLAKLAPAGCLLVRGYGSDGEYSMYLPSPRVERRIEFIEGKPKISFVGSCLDIPSARTARDKVLSCAARAMPLSELCADLVLVEYSTALLALSYKLSDEDLEFLHSGTHWREPLIVHALGGDDSIAALRSIDPARIRDIELESSRSYTGALLALMPPPPASAAYVESEVAAIVAAHETVDDEFDATLL